MAGLFSGGSSSAAAAQPPPMPTLQQPAPMPVPDPEEQKQAALRDMAIANAGKTTRANTIIGSNDTNSDRLGG